MSRYLVPLAAAAVLATGVWNVPAPGVAAPIAMAVSAQPADGYEPVGQLPASGEQLPAAPMVMAAYAIVWVALMVFVFFLWRRLQQVERELAQVAARLPDQARR